MKKSIFFAALAALFLVGCATKPVSVETKPAPSLKTERAMVEDLHKREVLATEWLSTLAGIVETTKNKHAHEILDMLMERGVVVLPTETGLWIPPFVNDTGSIRIIVLTPPDGNFAAWETYFKKNTGAMFIPGEYRAVGVKNVVPVSAVFRGFNLAHEGNHALLFLKNSNVRSRKEFCEEERDTYEFEFRLMASYAGYEQYVSREASRLASSVKKTADGEILFPWSGKYHTELDGIFGAALSEYEKKGRETITWIDIVFHAIDTSYAGDKEELKAEFACSVYADTGIIPKE